MWTASTLAAMTFLCCDQSLAAIFYCIMAPAKKIKSSEDRERLNAIGARY
jgi:hypothetical protein